MKANHKTVVPQKGTGLAGESLAVARPPNNHGGRATGSPPYSGEGHETLGAMHPQRPPAIQRTPTDNPSTTNQQASQQTSTDPYKTTHKADRRTMTDPYKTTHKADRRTMTDRQTASTSNAGVTPAPTAIHSAWTQVMPRQKRKKPKKKKNRQTDTTGKSDGAPTQETDGNAVANSNVQAKSLHGQSGNGQRPAAETVALGLDKGAATAGQPGTSGGQSTDAPLRHDPHTKYDHNPAQSRSHPVAYRSNAYWRRRSSGVTREGPGDPGPSTSQPSQKRDRLDDTISPRGEHKKRRTDRPTHGTGSYAQASQPHLSVAVALTPRMNLTQQEACNIQEQVEVEIFNTCLTQSTPGTASYAPAFEGRAFLSEGVLKLWCHDDQALAWLKKTVPNLKSPREGTELTLIRQSDIPTRIRSALFVPNYEGEVGKLHLVLTCQNPWYKVSTWTLYTYKRIQGRTPGLFLVLGIPQEQIDNILARGRKIAYSTGSIYIRFFTKEGVSDVPPESTPPNQKMTAPMDTDARTDDTEALPNPRTAVPPVDSPDSSASTVLEAIEMVLTEESSIPTPPPLPTNKTNWDETLGTNTLETATLSLQELLESWAPKANN